MKTMGSDIIPLSPHHGGVFIRRLLYPSFGPYHEGNMDAEGNVVFPWATDQYRLTLEYVARLYQEGLVDADFIGKENRPEEAFPLVRSNRVGLTTTASAFLPEMFSGGEYQIQMLKPLTTPYNDIPHAAEPITVYPGTAAIGSKNKYPEATMRLMDINYSIGEVAPGFNAWSTRLGIEGKDWEFTNPQKTAYRFIIPEGVTMPVNEYVSNKVAPGVAGWFDFPAVIEGSPLDVLVYEQSQEYYVPYMVMRDNPYAMKPSDPNELQIYNQANRAMQAIRADWDWKLISGERSFANWDVYMDEMKKAGLDEWIRIKQKAVDAVLK
jgi:putative aldouronate transport system substrate-binding protein